MDFLRIRQRMVKKSTLEVYPDFKVGNFEDFMVRGKSFYAVWDKDTGLWSTDEYKVRQIIDDELESYYEKIEDKFEIDIKVNWATSYTSGSWKEYNRWLRDLPDHYHPLDEKLIFSNSQVNKKDYASKRLPYPLKEGSIEAYDEIMSTLYSEEERQKLEWAIGAVISGDSKTIQKFIVLYGEAGAGKSTVLNIVQKLFEGYYTTFEAKALASNSNAFSTEVFKTNPLVAIQHDGDLSRIEDNTKLNSIISHEEMTMNEKYKPSYTSRVNCFLFMATNRPVKITDAKSGIIRRLIDVRPSGNKLSPKRYHELMSQVDFELGAIAYHCLSVYKSMGKDYYSSYRPIDMMFKTDVFFNFVESSYFVFQRQNGTSLKQAYDLYKEYCDEALVEYKLPKYKFREELKNYFKHFDEITRVDGKQIRNYYSDFLSERFTGVIDILDEESVETSSKLVLDKTESLFDLYCKDCKAQYASDKDTPLYKWSNVKTKLKDLDTSKVHYVQVPENHIVIDFDLTDEDGNKSAKLNLEAASKWPRTYGEFSKGGAGVHLHYIYDGDATKLSRLYSDGIEIKVFSGKSSLRRRLSKCNDIPIAHISSGLPLKGEKMISFTETYNEQAIRTLIKKNLAKAYHPGTKPSIDFIKDILDKAYASGKQYDVTNLKSKVLAFAGNSTHHSEYCIKQVMAMKFASEDAETYSDDYQDDRIVFFDVEVFPNLFLINWKYENTDKCVRMVNPTPQEVEELMKMKLIGFNCRRYDNHILYARYLGYTNEELFHLSQRIVNGQREAFFSQAYNLSYTDVYDFAAAPNKKSLKKYEIELGLKHHELGLPWDEPVSEDLWTEVAEYCDDDVFATEAVFNHLSEDWNARKILSELSGLSVNDTTNNHSAKIIFGNERHPQSQFVYTDLSEMFPGYEYKNGKSSYRGESPSEGGYVWSKPGMYTNVVLLDIASMHPTSIEQLNLFGPYTKVFSDIKQARLYIKHHEYDKAKHILDGKLAPVIEKIENNDPTITPKGLSTALKTVINSIYGLTHTKFENPFMDPRNVDNIVAKRGALFMIDLKLACLEKGWNVIHIKTDSIKIADATDEMIDFVTEFGKKYGYIFEHEATYDKFCIVNDSVYIAHGSYGEDKDKWTATGAQFQHPYVFKYLFSHEPIEFKDKCETKSVSTALYLDLNEDLPEGEHNYKFVGKVGSFCPIKPGHGGGVLLRHSNTDKYDAAPGTKGYRWLESDMVEVLKTDEDIDLSYHRNLVDKAVEVISKYGDFEWFAGQSDDICWCNDPENKEPDLKQCSKCHSKDNCDFIN